MPLFTHRCHQCDHQFEVLVFSKDLSKDQPCPRCDAPQTVRQVSRTSFSLAGEGWARDGYAKGGAE
ncbi:MAG: transcriptional regulator [Micrococcales bacterium]|nr:transcriptional regulator [Micrococcales bacterium]